eukprot:7590-Pleurochrysis_carterae.AAC.1
MSRGQPGPATGGAGSTCPPHLWQSLERQGQSATSDLTHSRQSAAQSSILDLRCQSCERGPKVFRGRSAPRRLDP